MREKKIYFIVTFHTTSDAMHLEKVVLENSVNGKLIPVPRSLTPGCGLAFRSDLEEKEIIKTLIEENDIEVDEMIDYEF